ncbi:hypothetical protein H8958_017260 [Nasalis larvatus]
MLGAADIMAEVEVVAQKEADEKRQEQVQRTQPGPGPMSPESALEELLAVQVELEPVNAQARKAFSQQREKMERRRKPQLDRRGAIIQSMPSFWANVSHLGRGVFGYQQILPVLSHRQTRVSAVSVTMAFPVPSSFPLHCISRLFDLNQMANHPQMSSLITDEDEDMLSYMINLEVKEAKHPIHLCQIMLFFRNNPYFQNKVITKEYLVNVTEYRASRSTPIQWCQDYEVEAYRRRHNSSGLNFFNWFSDHNFAGSSRIAEILCEDLWRNPLQSYRRMKPPEEGTEISAEDDPYHRPFSCCHENFPNMKYNLEN